MPANTRSRTGASFERLLLLAAIAIVAIVAVRHFRVTAPDRFVPSATAVSNASWHSDHWYWKERIGKKAEALVRVESGAIRRLATAEKIGDYFATPTHMLWAALDGSAWTIQISDAQAGGIKELWRGAAEPRGLYLGADTAYWLQSAPAAIPADAVLPPLGAQIELIGAPFSGSQPRVISRVMEPFGSQILGITNGEVWLTAIRQSLHNATTIYRVPAGGGFATRVVGETGIQNALLTPGGTLYWTAPCADAANPDMIVCIRRMSPAGKIETQTAWLNPKGRLFNTQRGVVYVDGGFSASAWPVGSYAVLPAATPSPPGYSVLSAGDDDLLLIPTGVVGAATPLYRVWPK